MDRMENSHRLLWETKNEHQIPKEIEERKVQLRKNIKEAKNQGKSGKEIWLMEREFVALDRFPFDKELRELDIQIGMTSSMEEIKATIPKEKLDKYDKAYQQMILENVRRRRKSGFGPLDSVEGNIKLKPGEYYFETIKNAIEECSKKKKK